MAALYLSTSFHNHPVTWEVSPVALGLWTVGLLAANQHREWGWVLPPDYPAQVRSTRLQAARLLDAGLWSLHVWGYQIEQYVHGQRLWKPGPEGRRRLAIPAAIRRAVYERDGYACLACETTSNLSLDHIQHWSRGGQDSLRNLRTLCRSCNSSRRTLTDDEWGRI